MTRLELLKILVAQARTNGFQFRRWYTTRLARPWTTADAALESLDEHRSYYTLLFSHEFARSFWKAGQPITFQVPAQTFERRMADGSVGTVQRKPYMRRSTRPDAWRYHLREMAVAEEPLRYMRRYLHIDEEESDVDADLPGDNSTSKPEPRRTASAALALARKALERKQLALVARPIEKAGTRGARLPGARAKST